MPTKEFAIDRRGYVLIGDERDEGQRLVFMLRWL